jgi:hypothetical protein
MGSTVLLFLSIRIYIYRVADRNWSIIIVIKYITSEIKNDIYKITDNHDNCIKSSETGL